MGHVASLPTARTAMSLDHRIAAAFERDMPPGDIAALLKEAQQAQEATTESYERARLLAFDPATRPDAVADARRVMEDAGFRKDRMLAASSTLKDLLAKARQREQQSVIQKQVDQATAERDQLAKDLRERYPALAAELSSMLVRLSTNNEHLDYLRRVHGAPHVRSAEAIARDVPIGWEAGTGGTSQPPLLLSRIAAFEATSGGYLWPR